MLGNILNIGFVCEHEYRDIAMKILCDDCGITKLYQENGEPIILDEYVKLNGVDKVEFPGNYMITFIRPHNEVDVRGRRFDQILVLLDDTGDGSDTEFLLKVDEALKFVYPSLSNSCVPEEYQIQFFTPIGKEEQENGKEKEESESEDA